MYKIIITTLIIGLYTSNSIAQFRKLEKRKHSVNKLLAEILVDKDFKNADFAFLAIDTKKHEIIASFHPDKSLIPASNQKLITTATALELYGPKFQFSTRLGYSGYIDTAKNVLIGDIIIKGGGDPTLGSVYFESTKNAQFLDFWLDAIKKLGIDSVTGSVIADPEIYSAWIMPLTWSWNNMGNYFGAGASGLTVYDNYYTIFFNTSDKIGDTVQIVRTNPEIPNLVFDNGIVTDSISFDNSNIYGAPYSYIRYLRGKLPLSRTNFGVKGSTPDPAYLVAYELNKKLKSNGIMIKDGALTILMLRNNNKTMDTNRTFFIEILSPKLSEIIKETNTHSINLFAEHLLNHVGLKISGNPSTEKAANDVITYWKSKGVDTQGMYLFDGSGLSRFDAFTARQMVQILTYMKDSSDYFEDFYNSLPIGGQTGTLKNLFKDNELAGNIRAKSGTVSRVKAYSGYIKSVSGRDIAFSMMANNFSCSSGEATKKLEKLMIALAEFKH